MVVAKRGVPTAQPGTSTGSTSWGTTPTQLSSMSGQDADASSSAGHSQAAATTEPENNSSAGATAAGLFFLV